MDSANDIEAAYARYGPALVRKAERMLRDRETALDLVQGLFADMLTRRGTPLNLPYLYRAITRRALNYVRDTKNRERLLEKEEATQRPFGVRLEGQAMSRDVLLRLVHQLDRRHAEVLVYCFVDEMTQEEAAALLQVSRRTVVSRLQRIRAKARSLLEGEGGA